MKILTSTCVGIRKSSYSIKSQSSPRTTRPQLTVYIGCLKNRTNMKLTASFMFTFKRRVTLENVNETDDLKAVYQKLCATIGQPNPFPPVVQHEEYCRRFPHKEGLYERPPLYPVEHRLVLRNQTLLDNQTLGDLGVQDGDHMTVYPVLRAGPRFNDIDYSSHIAGVSPADTSITIAFKCDARAFQMFPNLHKFTEPVEVSAAQEAFIYSGLDLTQYGREMNFTPCWTHYRPNARVLLLKVVEQHSHLSEMRYRVGGINGSHFGGDFHSWQRYTRTYPVSGVLTICEDDRTICFTPSECLARNTRYAILIRNSHNIPEDFISEFTTTHLTSVPQKGTK